LGWHFLVVWQCEIKDIENLQRILEHFLKR